MTGYGRGEAEFRRDAHPASLAPRDYSVPLHVDCSIEYELPDCAKPPQGVKIEPLLMIHPSHFRRLESLRRVPFVNNLPRGDAAAAVTPARGGRAPRQARRCCRAAPAPPAPAVHPVPAQAQRARAPPEEPCYRFESYAVAAAAEPAGGKLCSRARLKPHPYLPAEPLDRLDRLALDCDIARALQQPGVPCDRFDKRALHQLPQLPIYM